MMMAASNIPAVNGLLLDVSGSMKEVWTNGVLGKSSTTNKIHVIFEALEKFMNYARERNLADNLLFV